MTSPLISLTRSEYYNGVSGSGGTWPAYGVNSGYGLTAQTTLTLCMPISGFENQAGFIFGRTPNNSSNGHRLAVGDSGTGPFWQAGFDSSGTAGAPNCSSAANTAVYNRWQHAAVTHDGSITAANIKLYVGVNGAPLTSITTTNNNNGTTAFNTDLNNPLVIANRSGTGRKWSGFLAYVAQWNRVLSLPELVKAQKVGPFSVNNGLQFLYANGVFYGPLDFFGNGSTLGGYVSGVAVGPAPDVEVIKLKKRPYRFRYAPISAGLRSIGIAAGAGGGLKSKAFGAGGE